MKHEKPFVLAVETRNEKIVIEEPINKPVDPYKNRQMQISH